MSEEILPEGHPYAGVPVELYRRAQGAKCVRCGLTIVDGPSVAGTIMVSWWVPAFDLRNRAFLCGPCGLLFREFLAPELVSDEEFQATKAELLSQW